MAESFFDKVYKNKTQHTPDVLSCLANLSNDEVFTPPDVVNQMLDLLPQELFQDPNTTFLDPACKTGVFLREIAKKLLIGLEDKIPDLQERIDHIFHKQLFGISITELTSLLSRRSLYCSKYPNGPYSITKFDNSEGNIRYRRIKHTWDKNGKCVFCGTSRKTILGDKKRETELETHAYEWIHTSTPEEIFNMKFDVIISNPPYQMNDGGGTGSSAIPIYQHFVEQAEKLNPKYITMITPSRWFAGGKGLDKFRQHMLKSKQIVQIVDYPNSADCFPGVSIAGGVSFFLWNKDYNGDCTVINRSNINIDSNSKRNLSEFDVFVRDNIAVNIIRKIRSISKKYMDSMVYSRNCFGIESKKVGKQIQGESDAILYSLNGKSFISYADFFDKENLLNKYKVMMTKAMSGGNKPSSDGKYLVISNTMRVLCPNEVCTETYLCIGAFDNKEEADNLRNYLKTKFFRFLLLQALSSINISKDKFMFIPVIDLKKQVSDKELYKKFNLNTEEITYIESTIRPMEISGGES